MSLVASTLLLISTVAIHIISIIAAEGSLPVRRRLGPKSTYVFFIGLLIMRTYAFWKGNKKFSAGLLIVAAVR
jgi:hypothetical protein